MGSKVAYLPKYPRRTDDRTCSYRRQRPNSPTETREKSLTSREEHRWRKSGCDWWRRLVELARDKPRLESEAGSEFRSYFSVLHIVRPGKLSLIFIMLRGFTVEVAKSFGKRSLTSGEPTGHPTRSASSNMGGHPPCYGAVLFNVVSKDAESWSGDPRDESTGRRMPFSIHSVNLCDHCPIQ
jgi:hypothetical protein